MEERVGYQNYSPKVTFKGGYHQKTILKEPRIQNKHLCSSVQTVLGEGYLDNEFHVFVNHDCAWVPVIWSNII